MALDHNVSTLAERLSASGYSTYMSGKWHLGEAAEDMPHAHGFDRSFALAASGADNWDDKSYMPYYKDAPWFEDGEEATLPANFYSSEFIVDKMIEYVGSHDAGSPFFAYLPFQAIHIPVQAPQEFTAGYKGRYDEGWEAVRKSRHRRAESIGLIPKGATLTPFPKSSREWDTLEENEQKLYAARMEVNAAMLEAMDHHIGRFVRYLDSVGLADNTIFVITSDNGPEPSRGDSDFTTLLWLRLNGYHIGLERIGERGSWGFIGPEWALAAASPSALYKFYATEGGVRAPLIIAGPGIKPSRIDSPAMVTDVAPTLLDWVDAAPAPLSKKPVFGRSLLPVLLGHTHSAYGPGDVRAIEVSGNSALYKGEYKITRSMPPAGDGRWRLFNIAHDPGESDDLSARFPAVLADLLLDYERYAKNVGVLEMPLGYDSSQQLEMNSIVRALKNDAWLLVFLASCLLIFIVLRVHRISTALRSRVFQINH